MKFFVLASLLFFSGSARSIAQNYQALLGSPYAGSLNATANPASIVNNPYKWDLTLFSGQYQGITNALSAGRKTPFKLPIKTFYNLIPGDFERMAYTNFDMHLLNARIALNKQHSIAFGANLRGYANAESGTFSYSDTITSTSGFFSLNDRGELEADLSGSAWMEFYATYARTILNFGPGRLNAGLTLKYNRGFSGATARVQGVRLEMTTVSEIPDVFIRDGMAGYGYSATHDQVDANASAFENFGNMLSRSMSGFSADLGFEYVLPLPGIGSFNDDDPYFDYSWKFGLSVLDLGWNNFSHSRNSMAFARLNDNVNGELLNQKFLDIPDIAAMNDSLRTIVQFAVPQTGNFSILNPMRLVLNADRNINGEFFINANLNLNLSPLVGKDRLHVAEKNFITVTPRWERNKIGLYLPVQYNRQNQLWVGGALRAGPLFMGLHNIPNALFSWKKSHNGGGFIGIILRPQGKNNTGSLYKELDCPPY